MAKLGPLPPVPQMLKIRYLWQLAQHTGVNVFHINYSGTIPDATTMGGILSQLATITSTNLKGLIFSSTSLTTIEGTDLSSRTGIVATVAGFGAGSYVSGNALPDNTAACISMITPYRFRGGHPRLYLPGQNSGAVQNPATWTNIWTGVLSNAFIAWRTGINTMTGTNAPFKLQWVSYYTHDANHNPIYHPGGPIPYDITNIRVHNRIDTQRRRLGKET